jgi:hypothetical protein
MLAIRIRLCNEATAGVELTVRISSKNFKAWIFLCVDGDR